MTVVLLTLRVRLGDTFVLLTLRVRQAAQPHAEREEYIEKRHTS
jgi:hypothetical protein